MLKNRTAKARAAARFGKVLSRDKGGRARTVLVPGSDGKQYQVILRRSAGLSTECRLSTPAGHLACAGNSNGHVCYHSIAAVAVASEDAGLAAHFCRTEKSADRLTRLGGSKVMLDSRQGSGRLWVVAA